MFSLGMSKVARLFALFQINLQPSTRRRNINTLINSIPILPSVLIGAQIDMIGKKNAGIWFISNQKYNVDKF